MRIFVKVLPFQRCIAAFMMGRVRTYFSSITAICVPHIGQTCSSSGRGITTFSIFRSLKQSSWVASFYAYAPGSRSLLPEKRSLFYFRFIKEILLSQNVIGSSFTGWTEKLFDQIIYLFLKCFLMTGFFVNHKTERFDQLSLFPYHCFQL